VFTSFHEKYLCAERNGQVIANRTRIGEFERWTLIKHGGGMISLFSHHGKYLSVKSNGKVAADSPTIGPMETFQWKKDPKQKTVQFFSPSLRCFLCAERLGGVVVCNRQKASTWETWKFEKIKIQGQGQVGGPTITVQVNPTPVQNPPQYVQQYAPQPPAYPPNAYPPNAYPPPGAYPPGVYPPNAYPPNAYPPGSYPPNAYPPGVYPPPVSYPGQPSHVHPPSQDRSSPGFTFSINMGGGGGVGNKEVTCPRCKGQGGMGPFGPCNKSNVHYKRSCVTCNGIGRTTFTRPCNSCKGSGGFGAFGPCDIMNVHYRNVCDGCKGIGYL